jgi:hypothetical protein
VRDASAFDHAEFLGLARRARRDPHRLELFARHLDPDEEAEAVLPVTGGTLVITDRRALHLTSHLEVDGAWNVREFQGYVVSKEIPLDAVSDAERIVRKGPRDVEDALRLSTTAGPEEIVLSRGPERVVSDEDAARAIALLTRRSPSRGPPAGASRGRARSPG